MKKILLSIMAVLVLIGVAGCSSEKIKEFSTTYGRDGREIGDTVEFEYQTFLEGNKDDLEKLSVSEVIFYKEIENLILQNNEPSVEVIKDGNDNYLVVIGTFTLNTKGMSAKDIEELKFISSLKLKDEQNKIIEIKLK